MVGRRRALAGLALLGLAACAAPVAVTPPRPVALGSEQEGLASWYGHPYHGRRTASGEIYDMNDLTAAHPTMPLGVRVAVTNLDNGRTAEVRINDRGPFVDGRILDLSYAAARVLGADRAGVFPVRIRVVALPGSVDTPAGTGFTVQVGAFASRAAAESLRDVMSKAGEPATVSDSALARDGFYRVWVGAYADRLAAQAAAQRLAARGYPVIIVER